MDIKYFLHKFSPKYKDAQPFLLEDILLKFTRKPENGYEHLISLGGNCEIAFRSLRYFGYEESNLFNWYLAEETGYLTDALKNFEKIGTNGFYQTPWIEVWACNNTKIAFHNKKNYEKKDGETDEEAINRELTGRIGYLKEKFLNILRSDDKKLYMYAIRKPDIDEKVTDKIKELYKCLVELGGKNFKLLIICEEPLKDFFKPDECYMLRTVKMFADPTEVVSKKYFGNGFKNIFNEFYYSKKPRIKKKQKYKFDKK